MRIALVLDCFDPDKGGLERWGWQLAQWLVGHGHEVHVVAMQFADHNLVRGVNPHRFHPSSRG